MSSGVRLLLITVGVVLTDYFFGIDAVIRVAAVFFLEALWEKHSNEEAE